VLSQLPQLPMGTIVTVCMLIGVLFVTPYAIKSNLKPLPEVAAKLVGGVVFLGGFWNTFWHGIQNLNNFWGVAAFVSGIFLMLAGLYVMQIRAIQPKLHTFRFLILIGLFGSFLLYAITIARL